ncbi:acyl carrier protein [Geomonas sp. RF6]|uniref:acyl carrier protein n=1 Tax=Geomonas sp. RF6 TaxID=2897342 RepID=UPI001E42752C|nr:acyl carrier protein [Geomonas sp. RF6]UFS71097.1 acyl carrier protein [Geomonas sp. RF6]
MRAEEHIRDFLVENFLFGTDGGLDYDTSFLEHGLMDSTGVLQLVEYIGEEFSIVVEDEEIVPENLDTINRIVTFINRKRERVPVGITI